MSSSTGPQADEHIDSLLSLLETDPVAFQTVLDQHAESIARHLVVCQSCQMRLAVILRGLIDRSQPGSARRTMTELLLKRLNTVNRKAQVKNQLPAYVTAFYERGEAEANAMYPVVAAHLLECESHALEVLARLAAKQFGED